MALDLDLASDYQCTYLGMLDYATGLTVIVAALFLALVALGVALGLASDLALGLVLGLASGQGFLELVLIWALP